MESCQGHAGTTFCLVVTLMWTVPLSRAALGAAEGVSEVIKVVEGEGGLEELGIEEEKEEYLYTAFYKS